jgi:hypothetical protein
MQIKDEKMNREDLLHHLAEALMEAHGYTEETKESSPLEWNPDIKDSQYSMLYEDAETLLDEYKTLSALSELISMTGSLGQYPETRWDETTQAGHTVPEMPRVDTYVSIYHTLNGPSPTFGELREWMEKAQIMGATDDTVVNGYLALTMDVENAFVQKIEGTEYEVEHYSIYPPSLNDI